ncbi:MAG: hypothetical protein A3I12_00245 [Gammaproteobacteria bacterium RIFCSPLOWO2_02_FULL_38_11]|nr:MAG: hypothetical protein A3B69_06045 [Gammaproteobacteria bacterium RIFCSPHIGHO2_02_FULL_38_33]OGT24375.1 MAG: hypothetical protein A2W47_02320 [Gammaproteobacteria bacterium RIFCSPHIGHO2_12_38_15]OGT68577.1 MAG: hypothetical protein A3I12_00245 [Gammaproteobacteria bacterium RIFCSPLOWO2_02_FULL_38_11]OGT75600.1 MAG: hypothetical protein A3G71_00395 [Gammaproteobacteria bacterium RIFCSPLOWO2_12_FULL_38_14]
MKSKINKMMERVMRAVSAFTSWVWPGFCFSKNTTAVPKQKKMLVRKSKIMVLKIMFDILL